MSFNNHTYLAIYIIANASALLMIWLGWKQPRILKMVVLLVFGWASWTNWNEALTAPQFYLEYAPLTFFGFYRNFIEGWFSSHITVAVGTIATFQAIIALSMLAKGRILVTGAIGAIIFLLAIAPLGVGAACPCTVLMALAVGLLLPPSLRKKDRRFLHTVTS